MVIVYNPPEGKPISTNFVGGGSSLAKPLESDTVQYCEPALAEALVATYTFLKIITPDEAKVIKEGVETPVETVEEPKQEKEVDLDLPVVETKKVSKVEEEEKSTEIPDDLKGVGWYGKGVTEDHG